VSNATNENELSATINLNACSGNVKNSLSAWGFLGFVGKGN